MREHRANMRDRPVRGCKELSSRKGIPYLMTAEEEILNSISAGAPLAQLLNRICSALDCEIGNVVSLLSVPDDNAMNFAAVAENAKRFGLYTFCSLGVIAENGELLGILDMYSCEPDLPSAWQWKLVERAGYLAAIAIERESEQVRRRSARASGIHFMDESLEKVRESSN